jgi:DNA-directed RNA polymerase specialized sigma24 family protein
LVITSEQFEQLLTWLDADRECAGRKYETIRSGLLRVFISKGLNDAEDLADETINRVIARLTDIKDSYCGEPARYFHGVARNIIRETSRRKEVTVEVTGVTFFADPITSNEHECLDVCLRVLPPDKRDLILDYYLYEGHDKIEHHKEMSKAMGITHGALRGRAHQIRTGLEQCVKQCLQRKENKIAPKGH